MSFVTMHPSSFGNRHSEVKLFAAMAKETIFTDAIKTAIRRDSGNNPACLLHEAPTSFRPTARIRSDEDPTSLQSLVMLSCCVREG